MKTTQELFQKALSVKLNGNAYWKYVSKLRSQGSKETFTIAKELCLSADKHRRVLGIDVLCQLRVYGKGCDLLKSSSSKPFCPKKAMLIIRPMLRDRRREVILSAIYAMGHLHDPKRSKLVAPFARHHSVDVRYAVAFALGGDMKPLSINTLVQLTEDVNPMVRDWATFGIAELADAKRTNSLRIREVLFKRLHDTHMNPRGEAMVGLAKRGDKRVIKYIKRALAGKSPRVYALNAAEEIADPILLLALKDLSRRCKDGDNVYWLDQLKIAIAACNRANA